MYIVTYVEIVGSNLFHFSYGGWIFQVRQISILDRSLTLDRDCTWDEILCRAKKDLYLNKRILDSRDIIIFLFFFSFYITIGLFMYRLLSIFAEDVSYVPLPFPHAHTRLASFPQGCANSFENVGFLSNYLTSKLDSVSLSRLSARNWHTS